MPLTPFEFSPLLPVPHMVTTRHGGISSGPYASLNLGYATDDDEDHVAANRDAVREKLGIDGEALRVGRLSHGTEVAVFRGDRRDRWPERRLPVRPGSARMDTFFDADGVISDVVGLYFLLTFADCVPLLFSDPVRGVVGLAHAGWRGTAAGMAVAMLDTFHREFGSRAEDLRVGVGPSIGPCCYEVGPDVPDTFRAYGHVPVVTGGHLDLWASTARQLERAGVRAIEVAGICTRCRSDRFFSHRGEAGVTGRFGLVAGLAA